MDASVVVKNNKRVTSIKLGRIIFLVKRFAIYDGKAGEDAEVRGICQALVRSSEEALMYLQRGRKMRRTEKTSMNAESSLSHSLFTLMIKQTNRKFPPDTGDTAEIP